MAVASSLSDVQLIDVEEWWASSARGVLSETELDQQLEVFYGPGHEQMSLSDGATPLSLVPAESNKDPVAEPVLGDHATIMSIDPGTKNTGVVIVDVLTEQIKWYQVVEVDLKTTASASAQGLDLFYLLDDLRERFNVKYVVWERQMFGNNNLRSDGMYTMIASAWKGYGFVDEIAPVHPRTSHAFWEFPAKAGHRLNKETAVNKCIHLLMGVHSCDYVNNLIKLQPKMDDIADCYLNAIWYLRTTGHGKSN